MDQLAILLIQYPWLRYAVTLMIVSRLVFKPLFQIAEKYTQLTVSKEDDKTLHKIMNSKTYKMIVFILDLSLSVKLPKIKK